MNHHTGIIFPGQGSQYIGMGRAFFDGLEGAGHMFEEAEEISGLPIRELCFNGPQDQLVITSNLQPCLAVVDAVCGMALRRAGLTPVAVAGHSLGEYPALWMAGVLEFADLVRLVMERGRLMENAGGDTEGGMAAIIGLERDILEAEVRKVSGDGVLAIANHNSREQIVVTGEKSRVSQLCKAVKAIGARAVPLRVSGAFHSELMGQAAGMFAALLDDTVFNPPECPVYCNVSAMPERDPERIRALMKDQMCSPVRWFDIVNNMHSDGIKVFFEAGPKKVLSGLVKKSLVNPDAALIFQADDPDGIAACMDEMKKAGEL
jgi:[acyl-carrier-protein] S-malonyltransferase